MKIALGDTVKDPITDFVGIAYGKYTYIQGCDRIAIQAPMVQKENELPEIPDLWVVDEPQLILIKRAEKPKAKKSTTGGPSKRMGHK